VVAARTFCAPGDGSGGPHSAQVLLHLTDAMEQICAGSPRMMGPRGLRGGDYAARDRKRNGHGKSWREGGWRPILLEEADDRARTEFLIE